MLYCFLPPGARSIVCTSAVSLSLLSLAPAYCKTMHTYLTLPAAAAASPSSVHRVFSMIMLLHSCAVLCAPTS